MPQKTKEKPNKDFLIDVCLKGASDLRPLLHVDENGYNLIHFSAHQKARDFYVYGVLDDIEKAGIALINCKEFLSDTKGADPEDRISRNVLSATIDNQMMMIRKLTEILVDLILFSQNNKESYFKHYLLVKGLSRLNMQLSDMKEFYNAENKNYEHQVRETKKQIEELEKTKLNIKDCWYLPWNKTKTNRQSGKKGRFTSLRQKFLETIYKSTKDQKLILATYGASYSRPSQHIHSNIGLLDRPSLDEITTNNTRIGMLAYHILICCRKLINDRRRTKGFMSKLAYTYRENKYPTELFNRSNRPNIKQGDFVIVPHDHLGEVIKVNKSKYGYRSFTIRFLRNPMISSIPVDTFPASRVIKFYDRKKLIKSAKAEIRKTNPKEKIGNRKLAEAMRSSIIEFWKLWKKTLK